MEGAGRRVRAANQRVFTSGEKFLLVKRLGGGSSSAKAHSPQSSMLVFLTLGHQKSQDPQFIPFNLELVEAGGQSCCGPDLDPSESVHSTVVFTLCCRLNANHKQGKNQELLLLIFISPGCSDDKRVFSE
ncbi:hypothetical protein MG293_007192 [Ovis ammon polii]|uniref:Uncharacterized protein n=1 Tax=Ovis ammon polii TaxID=230172 RepID=A0AAD4UBM5_OVIAM|nr:hypothetical protein MG293_007192 [Ovis ammon polii]